MNRRQLLYALGGVGGATTVVFGTDTAEDGTGAFGGGANSSEVSVSVDDEQPGISLDPCPESPNAAYARTVGDELAISITPANPTGGGGVGVNPNARTLIDGVFRICNETGDDTCLWIQDEENWPVRETTEGAERRVDFYVRGTERTSLVGASNATALAANGCLCVGIETETRGDSPDALLAPIGEEIVLRAAPGSGDANARGDFETLEATSADAEDSVEATQPDRARTRDGRAQSEPFSVTALADSGLTPVALVESLVADSDVELVDGSVEFTGAERAAGSFSGGSDVVGMADGVALSSGAVAELPGANESPNASTSFDRPGDETLDELAGGSTQDAAVLAFEFTVPDGTSEIGFNYVFGSEEYNEFVGREFNDVFGFFLGGENVATVPDPDDPDATLPAAINTVNSGRPGVSPTNPGRFVNNDPFTPDASGETVPEAELRATEMDGFTVVLEVRAPVSAGEQNTIRLGVADTGDTALDTWVLVEAASFETDPDPGPSPPPDPDPGPSC